MTKTLVIDCRMSNDSKDKLKNLGYSLIEMPCISCLEKPVSAHPDMSMMKIKERLFVYDDINSMFTNFNTTAISRGHEAKRVLEYPDNVALNCAVVGDRIICNTKYASKQVLEYAENMGLTIIHVNQGYAKCSVCVVSDNAVITEDESISSECTKHGIDVLKITKGFVKLDGYDYGFIGGCSGLLEEKLLAFNGNIKLHPDCMQITDFCKMHGVDIICLNNEQLYDVGRIIRL